MGSSLHRAPCWGTWRLFICWDFGEEKKSISGSLFLDPENIKGLSLGAVWNFSKGTGLP